MKKYSNSFLIMVGAFVLFNFTAIQELAAQAEVKRIDINFAQYIDCTGEWVWFEGSLQYTRNRVINPIRGSYAIWNEWWHLNGRSSSGNEYKLNLSGNIVGDERWSNVYQFSAVENLISKGNAPNYQLRVAYHYTVNANGELTAYFDNFEINCK